MKRVNKFLFLLILILNLNGCNMADLPSDKIHQLKERFKDETVVYVEKVVEKFEGIQKSQSAVGDGAIFLTDDIRKARLLRVVDGDTLSCEIDGTEYKVRLIGINTPESVHPVEKQNTIEGDNASQYTKELLKNNHQLFLQFDQDPLDDYERLLAYVWIVDAEEQIGTDLTQMLNYKLAFDGYATVMTIEPNTTYENQFQEAMEIAIKENKGLWEYESFRGKYGTK